jgi:hypothetical protein
MRGHVGSAVVTDLKAFRRACHEAARRTGGELTEFRISDEPTPNFHQAIITYRAGRWATGLADPAASRNVAVVCLRDAPLMALAVPRVIRFTSAREAGPLTFVDLPDLAAALEAAPGFRLLTATELDGPIDKAKWPGISSYDMRYWQPQTLGEGHSTTGTNSKITHPLLPRSVCLPRRNGTAGQQGRGSAEE